MVLVLFLLALESLLANRFYRQPRQEAESIGMAPPSAPDGQSKQVAEDALAIGRP
jgi:hypothetical protein